LTKGRRSCRRLGFTTAHVTVMPSWLRAATWPCPDRSRSGMCGGYHVADSRAAGLWGHIAAHAAAQNRSVSATDICAVAVSSARLSGAWVVASRGSGPDFVMGVAGPVSEQLAELQLTLGEGPCHDVLASAAPVLAGHLGDEEFSRRWPAFTPAALQLGVRAVFALPLMVGAIRCGLLGLYRDSPGPLPDRQFGDLLIVADTATMMLLSGADADSADGDGTASEDRAALDGQAQDLALHRTEIDQATGMLTVQLGVPAAEAFDRLRAYAYSQDRRLADVAGDIVARRLRLHRDPGEERGR
jgi:ANTAR domain